MAMAMMEVMSSLLINPSLNQASPSKYLYSTGEASASPPCTISPLEVNKMASVTVVVLKDTVRQDKKGRTFAQAQDQDTNQFITFYPKKDTNGLFDNLEVGQVVTLNGTLHNIGDNPKVIVTSVS